MSKEIRQTVAELLIGIWIWTAVLLVMVLLVQECINGWELKHTRVLLGFLFGGALGSFMAVHMAHSINTAVDLGEQGALNHTRKMYVIRTAVVLACAVLLYYTGWVNILAVFAGLFGLKPAAYFQPVLHRCLTGAWPSSSDCPEEVPEEDAAEAAHNCATKILGGSRHDTCRK